MKQRYQVTLFDIQGRYKPVSALVNMDQEDGSIDLTKDPAAKKEIQKRGVLKICQTRYWGARDLKKYGYLTGKVRKYDPEEIARENAERYEKIKKERGWA